MSHTESTHFHWEHTLHELKHYLPDQAPLKDFIHHNTLHGFQSNVFFNALQKATSIFGYRTLLPIAEFRNKYHDGKIQKEIILEVLQDQYPNQVDFWFEEMVSAPINEEINERIGDLRHQWMVQTGIDLDSIIQPMLFRILCSYLDQGISLWRFPEKDLSFLDALRKMEENSNASFFTIKSVRESFIKQEYTLTDLLRKLVGNETLFEHYLFDQQFAHQGWSGMVSNIENQPQSLLDGRKISLEDVIIFELYLELDTLTRKLGTDFKPLGRYSLPKLPALFDPCQSEHAQRVAELWQICFEKSFYSGVLSAVKSKISNTNRVKNASFQAVFCIDDRECSIRRYVEKNDPSAETWGTPGFFGVAFYYQPEGGKFKTKLCPAPVFPNHLIKAIGGNQIRKKDLHFNQQTHSLIPGFLITQTLGFWSAIKLFFQIFRPTMSPATSTSLQHMDQGSDLTIEFKGQFQDDLQIGFTINEMADRVEGLLKSMGFIDQFAPLVYLVSHGSSSVNNPHFSAYDCGACSGRPGSVNARVICHMANHPEVRSLLHQRGIDIPETTRFVGALHDTTRDEMVFYDEKLLDSYQTELHVKNKETFSKSLEDNALERSRRFVLLDSENKKSVVHQRVRNRSVSLFEPRPELNHATNSLCIIGSRSLTRGVFLDRRSFLNSYDPSIDPQGDLLFGIVKAAAPVCGGINLEYFFSRVDNQRLGAGSKLPHNVMGLIGVANGIDGDLRPGLPSQMIEVHDPLRLLMIIEQEPSIVLSVIQRASETYEWFKNEWIHLVVISPSSKEFYQFKNHTFEVLQWAEQPPVIVQHLQKIVTTEHDNLPVMLLES